MLYSLLHKRKNRRMCVKENKFLTHFVAKKIVLMEKKVANTLFDKNTNVIVINQ